MLLVFDTRILSIVEAEGVKACTRTSDRGLLSHFRVVDKAGPLGGAGGRVPRGHVLETLYDGRLPTAVLITGGGKDCTTGIATLQNSTETLHIIGKMCRLDIQI